MTRFEDATDQARHPDAPEPHDIDEPEDPNEGFDPQEDADLGPGRRYGKGHWVR